MVSRGGDNSIRRNPVGDIRRALRGLPDQFPPPSFAKLLFIKDRKLAESIGQDLRAADHAFAAYEWKVTTVMSGAGIEALLHWRLGKEDTATIEAAKLRLIQKGKLKAGKNTGLDD